MLQKLIFIHLLNFNEISIALEIKLKSKWILKPNMSLRANYLFIKHQDFMKIHQGKVKNHFLEKLLQRKPHFFKK